MEQQYSGTEPGLSHPFKKTSIRLTNDGKISIQAGDHAGIIIDSETGVVSIYGTEIRFLSSDITVNGKFLPDTVLIDAPQKTETGDVVKAILKRAKT